jgi:ADP-heptose:LPS heptosyltransferase
MKLVGDLLVAAPERWDEACFSVPAVRALVASGLSVGVFCAEAQRKFWSMVDGVTVLDFSDRSKVKALAAEISGNWQASLAWECGIGAEVFKAAKIPRRLGIEDRKWNKRFTHLLVAGVGPLEHRVRHYLAAIESLGVETRIPEFFAPAAHFPERAAASVLLCPESDFGVSHEWLSVRWRETAEAVLAAGRSVTVVNVKDGRALGLALAAELSESVRVLELASMADILPLLRDYEVLVAADGTLPHLAAWMGVTCVTLFGPNDPAWKRPLGRRHAVVRHHVECAPCLLAKCPMDGRCQNEMETARVGRAVLEMLNFLDSERRITPGD